MTILAASTANNGQVQVPTTTTAYITTQPPVLHQPILWILRKACRTPNSVSMTLKDGKLLSRRGHTGYIASNSQFQFDPTPQVNALYTEGYAACGNWLALGAKTQWWQCKSDDHFNLYSKQGSVFRDPIYP